MDLNEAQESAYRALVGLGGLEVAELAHRLTLTEEEATRALHRLERHGLVARSPAPSGRWEAASTAGAPGTPVGRRDHGERPGQPGLPRSFPGEADGTAMTDPDGAAVEVLVGGAAVAEQAQRLRLGAAREVCALLTGVRTDTVEQGVRHVGGPRCAPRAEPRADRTGAAHRVVVERDALPAADTPEVLAGHLAGALHDGENTRLRAVERIPAGLVIADRTAALVPLTGHPRGAAALLVHPCELLDALLWMFESVWWQALPVWPGPGESPATGSGNRPDAVDAEILSLLLAGLTDTSVARRLGLGLRTVQRRVRHLMERAGVTTRLQLGWYAREHQWLTSTGLSVPPGVKDAGRNPSHHRPAADHCPG